MNEASQHQYVSPYSRALIYAGLGQNNEAMDELQKAYAERSLSPPALCWDLRLDGLRQERRYQDFARTTGLSQ